MSYRQPRLRPFPVSYDDVMAISTESLSPDEWWVIDHDEGPLWDTASKRMDRPVIIFCRALKCDWDDAQESGFRLAKLKREAQ